eukprot:9469457-Pyramimonas_sp.AAC.1
MQIAAFRRCWMAARAPEGSMGASPQGRFRRSGRVDCGVRKANAFVTQQLCHPRCVASWNQFSVSIATSCAA